MSKVSRARRGSISHKQGTVYGLLAGLCLALVTLAAAGYADANPKVTSLAQQTPLPQPNESVAVLPRADRPMVVALATPAPSNPSPPPAVVPQISTPPAPAPAKFFTINEVMAKRTGSAVQLAAVDPAQTATDANSTTVPGTNRSSEPFGLTTFVAPDGLLWTKWRKVEAEIRAEEPALTRCLADSKECSPAAARFGAIVSDARNHAGRSKFDLVNQRVNTAIRYTDDYVQWGVADLWSSPLATFASERGDCEDYAIAKYVALRAAGVPATQLRLMLVHDKMARMDHAVVAALDNGHWFILDNRWMSLVEDVEIRQFAPLFAIDDQGVKLLAAPYASKQPAPDNTQVLVPGG